MSSLAATQADGYYVGSAYYDSGAYTKLSKNDWDAVNAGSSKRKGHNQYVDKNVVRFELPYGGICAGCNAFVMRGTRFNAAKSTAGMYFTTTIYEFRMKCRACRQHEYVIRTNPQERGFDYVEGITKQLKDDGQIEDVPVNSAASNDLERLEQQQVYQRTSISEREQIQLLQQVNDRTYLNDADGNARVRAAFRSDRHTRKRQLKNAQALGWKQDMILLDESADDRVQAKQATFGNGKQRELQRLRKVRQESIFSAKKQKPNTRSRSDASSIRPDNVASSSMLGAPRRRRRTEDIPLIDLTAKPATEPLQQSVSVKKRKKIVVTSTSGVQAVCPTVAKGSLDALMTGYESSDSD